MTTTTMCPDWCTDHELELENGPGFHRTYVGDGDWGTCVVLGRDGKPWACWGSDDSPRADQVRRLGHSLIAAADLMEQLDGSLHWTDARRIRRNEKLMRSIEAALDDMPQVEVDG